MGGAEDAEPTYKRRRKKKGTVGADEGESEGQQALLDRLETEEKQLEEDQAENAKKLADKTGKKKAGSTAEATRENAEVVELEEDVEIDPVGTGFGGGLTKEGKNMSYTTASKKLKKIADNITNTTLERQIADESIFKNISSMGMVKIPVGYCVTGPVKVKGKVWNVNSRTINEEGVENLVKMFCAEGYSEFAPGMLGVVEVSCEILCMFQTQCVVSCTLWWDKPSRIATILCCRQCRAHS
jgi:hypothetical protein